MRLVVPQALTLVSSTATASSYAEWASGTNYIAGNLVKVTSAAPHREYRALTPGSEKAPAANPQDWLDLGVTNPYRILADAVASRSMGTTSIVLTATSTATASYLALVNMVNVRTVGVRILTGTGGGYETDDGWNFNVTGKDPAHERCAIVADLERAQNKSWQDWFETRPYYATNLALNLPLWMLPGNVLELTLSGATGAAVGCGHMVLGKPVSLGDTKYGARVGIVDYSRREPDEWGNIAIVQRAYAPTWSADIDVPPQMLDQLAHKLAAVRAVPCIFDGNPDDEESVFDSLITYGFYKAFSVLIADQNSVTCSLDVEGLV